jgi:uncharacterized protein (TIGR03118 family)
MPTHFRTRISTLSALAVLAGFATACSDDDNTGPNTTAGFQETPLVADASGLGASRVDPNLKNPWGIAINPTNGFVWVANNHSGTSTVYEPGGAIVSLVVTIPSPTATTGGAPTGIAFNSTSDFVIPGSGAATFLFAGEDGVISAWNQSLGTAAKVVIDRSGQNAVYLGLTTVGNSLFAANFAGKAVDMFDKDFAFVKSFTDPGVPSDYGPFNVQAIGGNVYVAFAKIDPTTGEEAAGVGLGYVSVFGPDGTFIKRFASTGTLNAPWGMAAAPASFGDFAGDILIGNFGDGRINVFDVITGNFLGQLKHTDGEEIELEGLWALMVGTNSNLYFAAGIQDEEHGLFGVVGPDQ